MILSKTTGHWRLHGSLRELRDRIMAVNEDATGFGRRSPSVEGGPSDAPPMIGAITQNRRDAFRKYTRVFLAFRARTAGTIHGATLPFWVGFRGYCLEDTRSSRVESERGRQSSVQQYSTGTGHRRFLATDGQLLRNPPRNIGEMMLCNPPEDTRHLSSRSARRLPHSLAGTGWEDFSKAHHLQRCRDKLGFFRRPWARRGPRPRWEPGSSLEQLQTRALRCPAPSNRPSPAIIPLVVGTGIGTVLESAGSGDFRRCQ